jgi:transcription antitermination factor NusA-like protein
MNIDVINYTSNIQLYITRALSPAKYLQLRLMKRLKEQRCFEIRRGFESNRKRRAQH